MNDSKFAAKKVSIIGFGKSGMAAAKLLLERGVKVFVSDKNLEFFPEFEVHNSQFLDYELGKHTEKILKNDLIILSPGVSGISGLINKAKSKGIKIWSELELGYRLINPNKIIAITGTNGKTTTTTLIAEICRAYNKKILCLGNIGIPFTSKIDEVDVNTIVILEVSSYQLEHIHKFRPDAASVLNITPDHLDRYKNIEEYCDTKCRIFKNQDSNAVGVYPKDSKFSKKISDAIPCKKVSFSVQDKTADLFYSDNKIYFPGLQWQFNTDNLQIPGMHNIENVMASIALTEDIVKEDTTILSNTLRSFNGVTHRLEKVRDIKGVIFINDSKSTNVDSTYVALKSFNSPIILLMGGRDKGASYMPLIPDIKKRVKAIVAFGEGRRRIKEELGSVVNVMEIEFLNQAVKQAVSFAVKGDVVLLSPACSSFDQFENFEDRGNYFKSIVLKT